MTLQKKALILSWFTVGYNVIEGIVSITAGVMSDSIALAGFGLDSFIESLSGGIMIWRFSRRSSGNPGDETAIENRAVRLVGITFFIFALYVLYESGSKLILREQPEPTLFGLAIALVSAIVMPVLYILKYRTGTALGSRALIADSKETLTCEFLSLSLLIGLGLNYLYGLWWADPAVGFIIVGFLVYEGFETLEEDDDDVDDD